MEEFKRYGYRHDTKKTTVNIVGADGKAIDSGMKGTYSPYDSSLSLDGTPKDVGNYLVSVTVTDKSGRTVTSDPLSFKIYSKNEKLADHLKLANATKTQTENICMIWIHG